MFISFFHDKILLTKQKNIDLNEKNKTEGLSIFPSIWFKTEFCLM